MALFLKESFFLNFKPKINIGKKLLFYFEKEKIEIALFKLFIKIKRNLKKNLIK
jgi:hypothetical protein